MSDNDARDVKQVVWIRSELPKFRSRFILPPPEAM